MLDVVRDCVLFFTDTSQNPHPQFMLVWQEQEGGIVMKPGSGWTRDPALHVLAFSTVIVGTALALSPHPELVQRSRRLEHPPGCHACSVCPADVAAARDAYLIRTGSIAPVDESE
jgi:hypothetical protein